MHRESHVRRRRRSAVTIAAVVAAMLGITGPSWASVYNRDCTVAGDPLAGYDCIVSMDAERRWDEGDYGGTLTFTDTIRFDLGAPPDIRPTAMTISGESYTGGYMQTNDTRPKMKMTDTWTLEQTSGSWSFSAGGLGGSVSYQDGRTIQVVTESTGTAITHDYSLTVQPSGTGATAGSVRHSQRVLYTYPDGRNFSLETFEVAPLTLG